MKKGIDVSVHQESVNWEEVANTDVEFVILRTGFGSPCQEQADKRFYEYLAGCRSAGLPTGAYHYGYATSVQEAIGEAEFCLSILDNTDMPYCVWYDVEEQCMFNVGADNLTAIVNAFCQRIEQAGYKAGIYMSAHHAQCYCNMEQVPYYKWIAQYNSQCTYCGDYDIWQYCSDGQIAGINKDVDMDYCYTDFGSDNLPQIEYEWVWYEEDKKYAVKENGVWVYDKWILDNGAWYRIDKDGWMLNCGWYEECDTWYFLEENGQMQTGWFWDEREKSWYFLDNNGRMVRSSWQFDEDEQSWYYLKSSGKMAMNEYIQDGGMTKYWLGCDGRWVK